MAGREWFEGHTRASLYHSYNNMMAEVVRKHRSGYYCPSAPAGPTPSAPTASTTALHSREQEQLYNALEVPQEERRQDLATSKREVTVDQVEEYWRGRRKAGKTKAELERCSC